MISRIRTTPAFSFFPMLLLVSGLALSGCNSGTSSEGGPELTAGHYFIQSDEDDLYDLDQYFVVTAGNRFEFVEYGYATGQPTNLCQVTRQAGTYRLGDSLLTLTLTADGESVEGCHMTKAQFQAYPFENIPTAQRPTQGFPVRNVTANGFEAKDLFIGAAGWKTYAVKADPYGFY